MTDKIIIGQTASVKFSTDGDNSIPAKIDTGADSSSVWASDIHIGQDGKLSFVLFGEKSPYYTGKRHYIDSFQARLVRSSSGHAQLRYQVSLPFVAKDQKLVAKFNLSDRSKNKYPVLLGRSLLRDRFLVDVSLDESPIPRRKPRRVTSYTAELQSDPRAFFEKYHLNNSAGDMDI